VLYEIPLPNDGKGYRFTEEELSELLKRIYEKGREDERALQRVTTNACGYINLE
jgi:hypothetical protein